MKTLFFITIILSVVISILFLGCADDSLSPRNDPPTDPNIYEDLIFSDKIELSNYPTFGSTLTDFKFNVVIKDTSLKISNIKYDFTFNQKYDTTLTSQDTLITQFKLFGYNTVIASVELEDNSVLSCSTLIWLTETKIISSNGNFYYEPNIYNGKMISVTNGQGHQAQLIDLNTFQMDCYFCGFESDKFLEMHISIPSFDGSKILFDNGTDYNFCYYDFVKNDSTVTDIPIDVKRYPLGQLTWSLDSKSIYYVSVNENYVNSGIKAYSFESNNITPLYDNGNYICVIPGQKDKLAILEKVNDTSSKLIIYNLATKSIEKEYSNIPFFAPFRMLVDSDRIYFDGELAFYSLSKAKTYYMQFDELDLSRHMLGEADINMDGNNFILGTWGEDRTLYSIILPNFF